MDERSRAGHDHRVKLVVDQVRDLDRSRAVAHVDKGGVHHVVPLPAGDGRFAGRRLDVSRLRHVLEVDVERRRCVAEPGVTFGDVVDATLPHGLAPALVPELEGITVGGAVAGCAIESASFRYGGFHDTCLEYEIVSGTGEVLTCSPEREPLLFGMIHGSYGTLGILTKLSFALIPAKPNVHVEYRRAAPREHADDARRKARRRKPRQHLRPAPHRHVRHPAGVCAVRAGAPGRR